MEDNQIHDAARKQMEQLSEKLQEIECVKCHTKFRVHAPAVMNNQTLASTMIMIVPTWSLSERVCPNCKTVHMPVIGQVELAWRSIDPRDNEPSRIIKPNGPINPNGQIRL